MPPQSNGNGDLAQSILLNRLMWRDPIAANQLERMIENSTLMSRQALVNRGDDPRRDIDRECGYPDEIDAEQYRKLYDREPVASRVVQVMPLECWQVTPEVYEDEDVEVTTPFEQAWQELNKSLRGESWFQDAEGSPIWEALTRLDVLSGIGSFGIALLGIDDGKRLDEPVEGFETQQMLDQFTQVGMEEAYAPQSERGPISMLPSRERPKLPYTVNLTTNAPPRRPEDEEDIPDEEDPQAQGPIEDPTADEGEPVDGAGAEAVVEDGKGGMEVPTEGEDGGMQYGSDSELGQEPLAPVSTKYKLLFIRCFDETLVQVVQFEANQLSPRYGQPVMYNVTLNDPRFFKGGTGLTTANAKVHWSRVLHVADNRGSSEVFGTPRMEPVYNRLLDLRKLHSGSAEMYWKGAFPGFNLVTHPQLGGDVSFDSQDIKDQMEQYFNGLQRYTAIVGASMNSMAPQVVDPASQIRVQLEAICIRLSVPLRVFMGSERGELASTQDSSTWNDRLKQRQNGYLSPRLISPLVDRLVKMQVLPEPVGYSIAWPDLSAATDLEKAQKAASMTTALAAYVSGGIENMMTVRDFLVRIMGFSEIEAQEIEQSSMQQQESEMMTVDPQLEQQMAEAQMQQMTDPELVPDNIQTGDQHHYEAGSMDKQAELEHERIQSDKEDGQGFPMKGGDEGPMGAKGKMPQIPGKDKMGKKKPKLPMKGKM